MQGHAGSLGRGSSPRVRGTPWACRRPPLPNPVHPRVCGELTHNAVPLEIKDGSSPRVRGTPQTIGTLAPTRTVHPRVCGELPASHVQVLGGGGSSPRVRGTRRGPARTHSCRAVHPRVCGELATSTASQRMVNTVHPRVCGELWLDAKAACEAAGSSPRVRGTQQHCHRPLRRQRFIPACAGNSRQARPRSGWSIRFIPACAGNSLPWVPPVSLVAVHPRVCGELATLG